jgi:hypothetical protein
MSYNTVYVIVATAATCGAIYIGSWYMSKYTKLALAFNHASTLLEAFSNTSANLKKFDISTNLKKFDISKVLEISKNGLEVMEALKKNRHIIITETTSNDIKVVISHLNDLFTNMFNDIVQISKVNRNNPNDTVIDSLTHDMCIKYISVIGGTAEKIHQILNCIIQKSNELSIDVEQTDEMRNAAITVQHAFNIIDKKVKAFAQKSDVIYQKNKSEVNNNNI